MAANLFHALFAAARPEDVLLETGQGESLTYGEMAAMSSRMAQALQAMGLAPNGRVVVQAEKSVLYLAAYLAVLRAGGVFVPLNTGYTAAEVSYFKQDAEPVAFLTDLEALWEKAKGFTPDDAVVARGDGDLAALLYTSGTTGRSKGAMLTRGNLESNARTLADVWRMEKSDVLLHALPIYHTHGLFVAVNTIMLKGAKMIFLPKFDAGEMLRLMPRASLMMGVPTFYVRLLDSIRREDAAHMRLFISGSAPLLAETHKAWQERTGHDILERYGMTETGMNTSNPHDGARIAGTVGFPLPGVQLRVTDPETGRHLPQGETGMIEVKGPNVFAGYWRQPEKTAQEFRADGFFITGDLGKIDAAGYVHILGRGKDLIISGGLNVYPKEVEDRILELPGIADCAVIGVPHRDFGEAVVAVCVGKGDEAGVIAALATELAKFKQPKRVIFVAELPRNSMGKVQKNVLRETYKSLFAGA